MEIQKGENDDHLKGCKNRPLKGGEAFLKKYESERRKIEKDLKQKMSRA